MSAIFISHSSKDNEVAIELANHLALQHHHSVFLDLDPEKGIVAGQSWERTLYRKLRACKAVIALCTDNYLSSHWCFAEIALARMEGKHIIALQVDPLSEGTKMPAILTERQFIDLRTNKEDGYRRLWKGLKEEEILGVAGEWDPKKPPYLGLSAFQEEHAPVFFGREDETRAGLELLDRGAPGLIMVLGASGTGKSSLVRASMMPRLRAQPERWLVVDPFRPGHDPFTELATSLEQAYHRDARGRGAGPGSWEQIRERLLAAADKVSGKLTEEGDSIGRDLPAGAPTDSTQVADERLDRLIKQLEELRERPPVEVGEQLQDFLDWSLDDLRRICGGARPAARAPDHSAIEPNELFRMADELRRRVPERRNARVLLIVDQFEELLGHDVTDHLANRFAALLRATLEAEHSPVMVLGTMRSDFLGAFQRNPAFRGIDFESLSLGPMKIEGMRRVIEEPAKRAAIELERGLPDRLLEDTEAPDALPLLSFTLWKLWRDYHQDGLLEVAEYEQLGGLDGAVAGEANAVLAAARREGREDDLRKAFLQMARVTEDGSYARRPVLWDQEELRPVHSILERFVERRLLVIWREGDSRMVEVAHEALFRSWKPLATWLDNHRAELMLAAQIKRDAATWDEDGRSADTLWRGGRLQQAHELAQRKELPPLEAEFIQAGMRRRKQQRLTLAGITLSVFVLLASAAAYSFQQKLQADAEKARALDLARVSVASQWLDEDPNLAALTLLQVENPQQTRFAALRMREALNAGLSIVLEGQEAPIRVATFSPDGRRVVTGNTFGRARVLNADGTGIPVVFDEHKSAITAAAFSPDGGRVVTASEAGIALVWDAATGKRLARIEGDGARVQAVAFSPDGQRILMASRQVLVQSADATGAPFVFQGHAGAFVRAAAFGPNGKRVLSAAEDGTARVWNADGTGDPVILSGHQGSVVAAAFSPDGRRVVTASHDSTARVWSADGTGDPVTLRGHGDRVVAAAFSPDGLYVVTASHDSTARVWSADSSEGPVNLRGHRDRVVAAAFSPHGDQVVTASADGTAYLWNARGDGEPVVLAGHKGPVTLAAFDSSGDRVLTASDDGTARVWHANGKSDPVVAARLGGSVGAAAFSPDGSRLATVSSGRSPRMILWPLDGSADPDSISLRGQRDLVTAAAFSPDGRYVVTGDRQGIARVWNADGSGDPVSLPWPSDGAAAAAFSPDGKRFAAVTSAGAVQVRSLSGVPDSLLLGEHRDVTAAAFNHDGTRLVTTSLNGTVQLWDAVGGRSLAVRGDTMGPALTAAAFSRDGERVLTVSVDSTARLWDARSGDLLATLRGHTGAVTSAAFAPDGRVVTASRDGTARVWDADGAGDPVVLKDDGRSIQSAAFSRDGGQIWTVSEDGTVRRWTTISHEQLRAALRAATNLCLDPDFRQQYLGQSEAEARAGFERCEQRHGRSQPD